MKIRNKINKRKWRRTFGRFGFYWVEYFLLRSFIFIIQVLPRQIVYNCGSWAAYSIGKHAAVRGKIIRKNLERIYGQATSSMVAKVFQQSSIIFLETARLYKWGIGEFKIEVEPSGYDFKLLEGNLLISAHLGNWEVLCAFLAKQLPSFFAVAKTQMNPLVEEYITNSRQHLGIRLARRDAASVNAMIASLRRGDTVLLVADQDAHEEGLVVDFLGLPASTVRGPAIISMRTGAKLIPVFIIRTNPGEYKIIIESAITATPDIKANDKVVNILSTMNQRLSHWIFAHPSQWLWGHRRWRYMSKLKAKNRIKN